MIVEAKLTQKRNLNRNLSSVLPLNRDSCFVSLVIIAEEVAEEAEEKTQFLQY